MKIKTKIFGTLLGMSLLVALVGALAVNRQHVIVTNSAIKEAEAVAHVLGSYLLWDLNHAQEMVMRLHETQKRDVVLMDSQQHILADVVPSEIGTTFTEDPADEVGATIKDRQVRTFVETSETYPTGIKQIVVPVEAGSGQVIGAVVLEYTPLYDELMQSTKTATRHVVLTGLGSVIIALLIAFYMGRSIATPLQQLTDAATGFASGKTDVLMPPPRKDEIGVLAEAFNHMVQKRRLVEGELRHARDELEIRVAERTAELAKTNEALQMENAERKRSEAALMETGALLETFLQNTTDEIYFKDLQSRFVHFSRKMLEVFHLTHPDEMKGRTDFDFFSEEHARPAFEAEQEIIRTGKPIFNVEEKEIHLDGRISWVLTSKMPWHDKAGNTLGTMGISRDITERKRIEAKLFQSQKLETVGKLTGGIAHEFNSILTAIIGQSELLLDDLPAGSPLAKGATEISKAAERAANLTRQLLAFGRKQILQPEILDLNAVLADMKNMLLHLMGENVDVRITSAVGLKSVKADAGQIEQVIVNIVMNAADVMPNGGRLTLETAHATLDEQYVSHFPELKAGEYVMLAITDTGAGMNQQVKARIFEPFFTTKGVGKGTGLGLATCHGIIKQSGGHIAVYSESGRGTTFKIYLPSVEPETKAPVQRQSSTDLPRGTETILLVEDDPALRAMAAKLLERLGYTVLTAGDGVEALKLAHQQGTGYIDLLFTDVVMPHMSGKELADRVQILFPKTRILFTSAYAEGAIVHQGALNPGVELLQKPFTPSALAHKVRKILDNRKT